MTKPVASIGEGAISSLVREDRRWQRLLRLAVDEFAKVEGPSSIDELARVVIWFISYMYAHSLKSPICGVSRQHDHVDQGVANTNTDSLSDS